MIEVSDIIDIPELQKIYKEDKLKFGLIMLIYAGALLETVSGVAYSEALLEKPLALWEHICILMCLVMVRYTCTQAIAMDDPIVGTIAVLLGVWYSYTVLTVPGPVGHCPELTIGLILLTTFVGLIWLYLCISEWIWPKDEKNVKPSPVVKRTPKTEETKTDETKDEETDTKKEK